MGCHKEFEGGFCFGNAFDFELGWPCTGLCPPEGLFDAFSTLQADLVIRMASRAVYETDSRGCGGGADALGDQRASEQPQQPQAEKPDEEQQGERHRGGVALMCMNT